MAFPNPFPKNFLPWQTWRRGNHRVAWNTHPNTGSQLVSSVAPARHRVLADTPLRWRVCPLADKRGNALPVGKCCPVGGLLPNLAVLLALAEADPTVWQGDLQLKCMHCISGLRVPLAGTVQINAFFIQQDTGLRPAMRSRG